MPWPLSQDYNEAVQSPESSFADPELRGGEVATNALGLPMPCSGNFADVYRFNCPASKRSWAVKCFTRQIPGLQERYQQISSHLAKGKPPFMVDFTFLDRGIQMRGDWYPILKMQWVEGFTLNQFVKDHLDKPQVLDVLCQLWVKLAARLRQANIAHCDLQHGNVLLVPDNRAGSVHVRLVDYDGMCVPALTLLKSIEMGHPAYQHPQRLREGIYSLEVDRFSHLVIYTALRSLMVGGKALWDKYDDGDNLLFKPSDFAAPTKSALIYGLLKSNNAEVQQLAEVMLHALSKPLEQVPLLEQCAAKVPAAASAAGSAAARPGVGSGPAKAAGNFASMTKETSPVRKSQVGKKRSLAMPMAAGILAVSLLAGAAFFFLRGGPEKPPQEQRLAHKANKLPNITGKQLDNNKPQTQSTRKPIEPEPPIAPPLGADNPSDIKKKLIEAQATPQPPPFPEKEKKGEEPAKGQTVIMGTWTWDIETNQQGVAKGADLWWWQGRDNEQFLIAKGGAGMAVLGQKAFDRITRADLMAAKYSEEKLPKASLTPGTVVALRTDEGNFAKLKVLGYRELHDFSFPEAKLIDDNWRAFILKSKNRKNYHLEVEWVLYRKEVLLAPATSNPQQFTNAVGIKFALVPNGKSWLGGGGGKPGTREVEIPDDFYLGMYAVTQAEWEALMSNNPSWFSRNGGGKNAVAAIADEDLKRFPVEMVSWEDAQRFIEKLNDREKHVGWLYRLPKQAEWEYACRGGAILKDESAFDFYFDRPTNDLSSTQANFDGNFPAGNAPKGRNSGRPTKVGTYTPNRLGLYDMHGNVYQWCEDAEGSGRALRGGSWGIHASSCRAGLHSWNVPSHRGGALDFRLARVPVGKEMATIPRPDKGTTPSTHDFFPLFNGKDLTGWHPNPTSPSKWMVKDGAVVSITNGRLYTSRNDYADFHLRAEVLLETGAVGSLQFRSDLHEPSDHAYKVQLHASAGAQPNPGSVYAINGGFTPDRPLYNTKSRALDAGQWHSLDVLATGWRFVVKIDGKVVAETTDEQKAFRAGHIALQRRFKAKGNIRFRRIEIKELKAPTAKHQELQPRFTNSLGMEFVLVGKGSAWLGGGARKPGKNRVSIAHDFYLGVYDVTQGEWEAVMGYNPSWFARNGGGSGAVTDIADGDLKRFPVEQVSWLDTQQFIEKLNSQEKHVGWVYRLPMEAEWEYACRGGAISRDQSAFDFYFEQPTNDLSSTQANFNGNFPAGNAPKGKYLERTTKVGSYQPNRLGIYDMHGNVCQWCEDGDGSGRQIRSGGWHDPSLCRAARRAGCPPSGRRWDLGFRLARVPSGDERAAAKDKGDDAGESKTVKLREPHAQVVKNYVPANAEIAWRGNWRHDGTELMQSGKAPSFLLFGNRKWEDFNLDLDAQTVSGEKALLIVFRASDLRNFYIFGIGSYGGKFNEVVRVEGGDWIRSVPPTQTMVEHEQWYKVRVEGRGDTFHCFVDGKKVFDFTDGHFPRGKIGVGAWANGNVRFRDIRVTSADAKTVLWEGLPKVP